MSRKRGKNSKSHIPQFKGFLISFLKTLWGRKRKKILMKRKNRESRGNPAGCRAATRGWAAESRSLAPKRHLHWPVEKNRCLEPHSNSMDRDSGLREYRGRECREGGNLISELKR